VLVDIGCGNGAQTALFAPAFSQVVGLDVAAGHLPAFGALTTGARGVLYDGERFPLADACADCVTCFAVLEHVAQEGAVLAEMARVLRPDGALLLSVPHRWWVFETHGASLPWLPWNRVPLVSWWPTWLHDRYAHARIYTRRDILSRVRRAGLRVDACTLLTAPMDVVRNRVLQGFLRGTVFRSDETRIPFLAVEILLAVRKA
jgi:SAM-dependent methyltransferase